ncbi:unnamed protein product [Parajaminaea phylloscopi]
MDKLIAVLSSAEDRATDFIETGPSAWKISEASARDLCRENVGDNREWTLHSPPTPNPQATGTLIKRASDFMDKQARSRYFSETEK